MLNSEPKTTGNRKIVTFAAATAAMALLASCAVAVPLPPLTTFSQGSRDLACTASKCRNGNQVAYRRAQPVGGGKIEDDPPDFILRNADQDGTPPTRTQLQ